MSEFQTSHSPTHGGSAATGPVPVRVSIVMPAYNHESYVEAALESVRTQTLADWELIVIDDGSTDRTYDVIRNYVDSARDPRVRILRQRNAGSHATINRGLELATAPYLAILNSDDCFAPDRLERLCAIAEQHVGDLFAVTAVRLIDGSGAAVGPGHRMYGWWRMYAQMLDVIRSTRQTSSHPFRDALLWGNFTITTSNFFFSRGLYQRLGPFRRFRYVLDWEYAIRVSLRCPDSLVFLSDECLLDYRLHGQNTIFGGAIRNHIEASYLLRSSQRSIARSGDVLPEHAVRRVRYLDRFVRQEQARIHARDSAISRHKLEMTEAHVGKLDLLATELHRKLASAETTTAALVALVESCPPPDPSEIGLDSLLATLERSVKHLVVERDAAMPLRLRLEATVQSQRTTLDDMARELSAMRNSRWWRAGAPLRWVMRFLRQGVRRLRGCLRTRLRLGPAATYAGRDTTTLRQDNGAGTDRGTMGATAAFIAEGSRIPQSPLCTDAYAQWLADEEKEKRLATVSARVPESGSPLVPRRSIVFVASTRDASRETLSAFILSVCAQVDEHWELLLAEDRTTDPGLRELIETHALRDSRIHRVAGAIRGSSGAAATENFAARPAEFVVLVEPGIELEPTALLVLARAIEAHPGADVLYSDHDHLDASALRCLPRFKPDWSPTLLWTTDYIGGLVCVRRALLDAVGIMDCADIGDSCHRLILRIASRVRQVHHIPRVLYHRRLEETRIDEHPVPVDEHATSEAIANFLGARYGSYCSHLERGREGGVVVPRFRLPPDSVASIIIPTRDRVDLLQPCVASILELSSWRQFEILILDNNSIERETARYLTEIAAREARVRTIPAHIPFNWSKLNNLGRKAAQGNVLLFLNNDTRVLSPDWLERLMEVALLPDVATVGPMLLFEDMTIQHAGVVVGMGGWADHVYRTNAPTDNSSPFVASTLARNVLANTGAAMAIASSQFDRLGGFDESFEICGSDVEIGIRAHKKGLLNVYLAGVCLLHLESKTRSPHVPEVDFIQSDLKYAPYRLGGDPYYNPNLGLGSTTPVPSYPAQRALGSTSV